MKKEELLIFLQSIPQGKVTTYGILAKHFDTSPRAIARMLASNTELDTYPCYKVVASTGDISGYRGGVEEKKRRLGVDGISISPEGKMNLSMYCWLPDEKCIKK